ncbi:hypothetical protein PORY_002061 [Pneumocystis oryctolagi]|uniref:Uncharacterized protein n=1 Tax=Pneumocystis oryctolagi TaxID=42067 RepID=A0ACB7CCK1_9ASCO|nr:hypothetical protein PORY_002061 [Pneumocystis oryctolagi]
MFSLIFSSNFIRSRATPSRRYSEATDKAVTWPCHSFPIPSIVLELKIDLANAQDRKVKNEYILLNENISVALKRRSSLIFIKRIGSRKSIEFVDVNLEELLNNILVTMAKSKNHTNHNQNKKAHKNGIHRPKRQRYLSMKYLDPKFRLNCKYATRGTQRALKEKRER